MPTAIGSKWMWLGAVGVGALLAGSVEYADAQSSNLPPVTVDAPNQNVRRAAPPRNTTRARSTTRRVAAPARAPQPVEPRPSGPGIGPERANGPVVGYAASQSATSTKTDTPLLETPQSVSVVTKDQIVAQQSQTINEALRYTPGVTLDTFGATTFFDSLKIRGFDAPRYLDGLRLPIDPGTQFATPRIEPYGLERIEVLKGPSSGLYGQTEPGGFLNMISKRPTAFSQNEVTATFGNFNRFQGTVDSSGLLDPRGEFLYRIVGLARQSDTQTDFLQDNKLFIAPSFTWRPTNDTTLTILAHYQDIDNRGFQQYIPGGASILPNPFGRIPYSRYLGEPAIDGYKLKQGAIGYSFEQRLLSGLSFRSNFRYTDVSNDLKGVRPEGFFGGTATGVGADFRTVPRSYNYVMSGAQNIAADNHVQADFATGPVLHKVLLGVDYFHQDSRSDYKFAAINPIDFVAPVYGAGGVPPSSTLQSFILTNGSLSQTGTYLQDQLKLDRWTLTLTGRYDNASARTVSRGGFPAPGTYLQNDSATTGRIGLNYLFDFGLSPYASYSTSFTPTSGTNQFGAVFKPATAEGKEVGFKYNPVGSNLFLTGALFEITQQNVLTADPTSIFFSVQTGEVRVRGFEFEARGNLTRELEIVGGYSKLLPVVTKSNDGNVGLNLVNVAKDTVSLWGKYTWFNGPVAGLGVGAGVRYVGETFGDIFNTVVTPSYVLFDAGLSYDFAYLRPGMKGWSAQVNATNLTNKFYVASCVTAASYCGPGAARTVLGTLRYRWN